MKQAKKQQERQKKEQIRYESPRVISFNDEAILEELGPAQALYGGTGAVRL